MTKFITPSDDPKSPENVAKYEAGRKWVFMATFINYAFSHWTRKSYTNIKVSLMAAGVDPVTLTAMDSGFMFTYAGGSFITGQLGDRFSPVAIIAAGLLGSSLCLLLILFGASSGIVSNTTLCGTWFLTCQLLHGAFQATGGPVNTAIMGSWFPAKGRGLVFGLWTCHQYVGDIVAALAAAYFLSNGYDWRLCITVPAVLNGIWAFVNYYSVSNNPEEAGIITESSAAKLTAEQTGISVEDAPPPIGFIQAFLLPNVLNYSIAFGFFKLVNYAMFFQLPVILAANFSETAANMISLFYSVGMMPGGIVCGWVSDLYGGRRALVIATFMCILMPLLLILALFMDHLPVTLLLILLVFMGMLVGGPNNIITSAVAADLSEDPSIKGNNRALGTVTGIINGSGSITAAIGQLAIPVLYSMGKQDGVGYRYVWFFLIVCTAIGTACMSPKIYKELNPTEEENPLMNGASRNGYSAVNTRDDSRA